MKVIRTFALAATLAASACATVDPPPADLPGEVIVYAPSYGPFCFSCVFTTLTVAEDGRVWIEREQDISAQRPRRANDAPVWRRTRELITVRPEQLAAFRSALAPYRPQGQQAKNISVCEEEKEDGDGVDITWRSQGREYQLHYVNGCGPNRPPAMRDDLLKAPALLGIVVSSK